LPLFGSYMFFLETQVSFTRSHHEWLPRFRTRDTYPPPPSPPKTSHLIGNPTLLRSLFSRRRRSARLDHHPPIFKSEQPIYRPLCNLEYHLPSSPEFPTPFSRDFRPYEYILRGIPDVPEFNAIRSQFAGVVVFHPIGPGVINVVVLRYWGYASSFSMLVNCSVRRPEP